MPMLGGGEVGRLLWRVAVAFLAAVLLTLVIQLHNRVLRQAFTLLGLRVDVPAILDVQTGCPSKQFKLLDLHAMRRTQDACGEVAQLIVTVSGDAPVLLANNRRVSSAPIRLAGPLALVAVRLRPGINEILLAQTDRRDLPFPFLSYTQVNTRAFNSYEPWPGSGMNVHVARPPAGIRLRAPATPSLPGPEPVWPMTRDASGVQELLVQGSPGESVPAHVPLSRGSAPLTFGADGFAVVPNMGERPSVASAPPDVRRSVAVTVANDEQVTVTLAACLPRSHTLVRLSQSDDIEAPELILHLTGLAAATVLPIADPKWEERWPVVVGKPADDAACVPLEAAYTVPTAFVVSPVRPTTFLRLPGDELTLHGVRRGAPGLLTSGGSAPEQSSNILRWTGLTTGAYTPPPAISYMPTSLTQRGALASSTPRRQTTSDEEREAARLNQLDNLLRRMPGAVARGLPLFVPVAIVLVAVMRQRGDADRQRQAAAEAGLFALLAFGLAAALRPAVAVAAGVIDDWAGLRRIDFELASYRSADYALAAVTGLLAAALMMPILRASHTDGRRAAWLPVRLATALATVALGCCAIGAMLLMAHVAGIEGDVLPARDGVLDSALSDAARELATLGMKGSPGVLGVLGAWTIVVLLCAWMALYWLIGTVARRGPVLRAALGGALLLFFLPWLAMLGDALAVLGGLVAWSGRIQRPAPWYPVAAATLQGLATLAFAMVPAVTIAVVLRAYRDVAGAMVPRLMPPGTSWLRGWVLLAVSLLLVTLSLAGSTAEAGQDALRSVPEIIGTLLGVGAPLGLLGLFGAAAALPANGAPTEHADGRHLTRLATAAFAVFLPICVVVRPERFITVLALTLVAWLVFRAILVAPQYRRFHPVCSPAKLVERILEHRRLTQLIEARRRAGDEEFSARKLDTDAWKRHRSEMEAQQAEVNAKLGLPVEEARRELFADGPGESPLAQAAYGAVCGLAVALALEGLRGAFLGLGASDVGAASGWVGYLRAALADPVAALAPETGRRGAPDGGIFGLFFELWRRVGLYVVLGTVFGLSFRLIRGRDGFAKGLIFAFAVAAVCLLGLALGPGFGGPERLISFGPLLAFPLLLGCLGFDGRTLILAGHPLTRLPQVYGLETTAGYASIAGVLAVVQPLLSLLF